MQIVKKEIFYFNSLKVVPLWKGALKSVLFKAASQPEAEMNNYQLACRVYRGFWQKTTQTSCQ